MHSVFLQLQLQVKVGVPIYTKHLAVLVIPQCKVLFVKRRGGEAHTYSAQHFFSSLIPWDALESAVTAQEDLDWE